MSIKTRIEKIESFFGYPLPTPIRARIKAEITDDPDTPAKETDAFFVDAFLDWKGEHWDGPNPAHPFLKAMCGGVIPPAQLRPEDPMRMTLHFCGLFLLDTESKTGPGGWIQDAGYWVADANPRQDGIKTCPVYHYARGEKSGPYLLESPERLDAWRDALSAIESLDEKVEAKKRPPLLKALMASFPWPVVADRERLLKRGILETKDTLPSVKPPADSEAERLSQGMEVCLPIAEVLSARAHEKPDTLLPAAAAKKALAFADKNPDWPPSQVLRLQAHALAGDMQKAEAEAKRLLGRKEITPLARRWADRIVAKQPPYDR
jgi:hypothetical protein